MLPAVMVSSDNPNQVTNAAGPHPNQTTNGWQKKAAVWVERSLTWPAALEKVLETTLDIAVQAGDK